MTSVMPMLRQRLKQQSACGSSGYLAITAAIILAAVLTVLALSLSFSSFFNSSDVQDSNLKESSYFLAEACGETALLKLSQNSNYSGNEIVSVASGTCKIFTLEASSSQKIIKTQASSSEAATNLKIIVQTPSLDIVSWEEY
ncbi:MAG: hypothetical protein UT92_C0001G0044 [Candidatus Curtissbacteria bacterium GW2011_GWA1_40_24]|uniref:Type 4 fimbrial biogenesis protein PilX N-terminal domain-containing protein n=2 Tax=Patescibacteria group TaxID=1783273 RepID=A0A0G0S0E4_9BACT|nr:MAG: hypothetical protein UT92_C0001G0044 [Candidatus Curtissbacteria bacterium GW2011_GWA1_40_24]KKR89041.1 MAG: hypothetical protein UU38_C0002G0044 [Candidatus Wolfebacteria bacterium GW2011_GWB1_41_12]